MHLAIIYSLPTRRALATPFKATDEDTKVSAEEVAAALKTRQFDTELIPVTEDTLSVVGKIKADLIFNLIEWDGLDMPLSLEVFAELEALGVPFTGCSLSTLEKVSDKIKMKETLDVAGILTPQWQLFTTGAETPRKNLRYPLILKLGWEHCSVGLTRDAVVTNEKDLVTAVAERLSTFKQPVYAEEFITGREFQVTLLSQKKGLTVLPPAEIIFEKPEELTFLTFSSRWDEAHADYKTSTVAVAKLNSLLKKKLEEASLASWNAFGCRDVARIDIRAHGNQVYVLEANPNPGIGEDDLYGMTVSHRAAGLSFPDFIMEIVESAVRRSKICKRKI